MNTHERAEALFGQLMHTRHQIKELTLQEENELRLLQTACAAAGHRSPTGRVSETCLRCGLQTDLALRPDPNAVTLDVIPATIVRPPNFPADTLRDFEAQPTVMIADPNQPIGEDSIWLDLSLLTEK